MKFRFPWVRSNQRIVPKDFVRLSSAIEDLVSHVARHMVGDPESIAASAGVVLWGLSCTDATDGTAKVRVSPGAALLPTSAGDRQWRLVTLDAAETISLSQKVGGNRTDTIQLELLAEPALDASSGGGLEESEQREFRTVVSGVEQSASSPTPTYRKPAGNVTKVEGGLGVPSAGAVLLAKAIVSGNAVTVGGLVDMRHVAFPDPVTPTTVLRGASTAYLALKARVEWAFTKMSTVIDTASGGMVSAATSAAGGPTFGPGAFTPNIGGAQNIWRFNDRAVVVNETLRAGGLRPIPAWLEADATPHPKVAAHYENDVDGLKLNAAMIPRAMVSIRHYPAQGAVPAHFEWIGQNVTSVTKVQVGVYQVTFAAAAFTTDFGSWWSDRWIVRHYSGMRHTDTPTLSYTAGQTITDVDRDDEAGGVAFRVRVSSVFVDPGLGNVTGKDSPVVLELYGPVGASTYNSADFEPGAKSASWSSTDD